MDSATLIETITEHTALLKELYVILERETADMASINLGAMNQSNQSKESLITHISKHAQQLQQHISKIAQQEGLASSATLGTVADHVAKKGNKNLQAAQKKLRAAAEQVQQAATLNSGIAERFVATTTESLTLISRMINQSNVYGASGGYQHRHTGAVIINREA